MHKKICVYTCITGDYDNLYEVKTPEKNIDYYCFTNNQSLKSKTWQIVQIHDDHLDNCRLARKIKTLGHPTINDYYDIAVWTDADVVWQKPVSDFIKTYHHNALSIFKHSSRDTIHKEIIACLTRRKDTKESIEKTLNFLNSENFPDTDGLYESTVFIKNLQDKTVQQTMQIWFDTIQKYSRRDQLSFPYAIWKTKLKIDSINLNVWNNPWFYTKKHSSKSKINDCHIYYGDIGRNFSLDKYHIYEYSKSNDRYSIDVTIPNHTNQIELNPIGLPGAILEDFNLSLPYHKLENYNTVQFNNNYYTCSNYNKFVIHGSFKKGQKLTFSVTIRPVTSSTFSSTIEKVWLAHNRLLSSQNRLSTQNNHLSLENKNLSAENASLRAINKSLEAQNRQIINSKGWRFIRRLRGLFPPYAKQ